MAYNDFPVNIPGRLKSAAVGGVVADAEDIYDDVLGKSQHTINSETEGRLDGQDTKIDRKLAEIDTKYEEFEERTDELFEEERTANRQALNEATASIRGNDTIIVEDHTAVASPEANKIYREYGETSYADWQYQNSAWAKLAEYNHGVDDEPTAGSDNLVKSGGIKNELALGAIYDVSAKNPTAGPNNDGKFESLSALLSDADLNTLIPTAVRKGGMSIKFVQSSDNKYVQYRLISDNFNTTPANWQGVDDKPVKNSKNLIEGGGVYKNTSVLNINYIDLTQYTPTNGYINNGKWTDVNTNNRTHIVIPLSGIKVLYIIAGDTYQSTYYFLSAYNVSEGGNASVISGADIMPNTEKALSVPTEAQFLYLQYSSGSQTRMPSGIIYNDSINILETRLTEAEKTLTKSNDCIPIRITSLDGVDAESTYTISSNGARAFYRFPCLNYTTLPNVVMSSDYQVIATYLDKDGQTIFSSGNWANSYSANISMYDTYANIASVRLSFRKSDDSAFTLQDLALNGISSIIIDTVISVLNEQFKIDTTLLNSLIRSLHAVQQYTNNTDSTPTKNSTKIVTSGGVYEKTKVLSELGVNWLDLTQYTETYGEIKSGKWRVDSNRMHIAIPLNGIQTLFIMPNSQYSTYVAFLAEYNVQDGGSASVIGSLEKVDTGKCCTVPNGANYFYIQTKSLPLDYTPKYVSVNDNVCAGISAKEIISTKSQDYVPIIASDLTGLGESITSVYNPGLSGTRVQYTFPILVYSTINVVMNSGYNIIGILYNSNGQEITRTGWQTSYTITDSIYETYPNLSSIGLLFKKEGDAAFVVDDLVNNGISSMTVEFISSAWNPKNQMNLKIFDKIIRAQKSIHLDEIEGVNVELSQYTPVNGYILGGYWKDTNSPNRRHIVIPLSGIKTLSIRANTAYPEYYAFLSDYNVVEDGNASIIGSQLNIEKSTKVILQVPSNATYLYLQYNSGSYIYLANEVRLGGEINDLYAKFNPKEILDLNPETEVLPKLQNLKRQYIVYGEGGSGYPSVLSLIHCSDVHADNVNILRIKEFYDKYHGYINDVLDTGDFIGGQWSDGLPSAISQVPNFIRVMGNHDTTLRIGTPPNHHWEVVDKVDCYNQNVKDYIGNWGVVQPSGVDDSSSPDYCACYYYKDYTSQNVRLICLDGEHWDTAELQWFTDTLASAKTAGLHVLVAVHRPPFATNPIQGNTFDSIDWPNMLSISTLSGAVSAINDFMAEENGVVGHFICWLCGHIHQDCMGLGQGDASNQLVISISTASVYPSRSYSEMGRSEGNKTQDCFNIIGIDTYSKILKLMRIGAQYDRHMRKRDTLCWDYSNNRLIYCG